MQSSFILEHLFVQVQYGQLNLVLIYMYKSMYIVYTCTYVYMYVHCIDMYVHVHVYMCTCSHLLTYNRVYFIINSYYEVCNYFVINTDVFSRFLLG